MDNPINALAQYRSHKVVRAGKILSLTPPGEIDSGHWVLQVVQGSEEGAKAVEIKVKKDVFARSIPEPGAYFVVYADGYQSWSPAAAFEEGYNRIQNS